MGTKCSRNIPNIPTWELIKYYIVLDCTVDLQYNPYNKDYIVIV